MQQNPKLPTTPPLPGVVAIPAINDALQTIATDFSGDTDPAALAWPYSKWADTSTGLLKRRNGAGTAWVIVGSLLRRPVDAYPSVEIPTTDQGPVVVSGQGNMEWTGSRYVATNASHGQCRLAFVSQTECRLMPCNGNGLVIDGKQYRIDLAGVALPIAAVAGANGTANYVYAKDNGTGGVALEGVTAGHSRHSDGIEIKTGDPSRTLVGVVYKNVSGQFQFDTTVRGVSSWFNRQYPVAQTTNFSTGTASASPVGAMPGVNVWCWEGEGVRAEINGRMSVNVAGANSTVYIYLDGVQAWSTSGASAIANANVPFSIAIPGHAMAEGFHYVSTYLSASGGSTSNVTVTQFITATPSIV